MHSRILARTLSIPRLLTLCMLMGGPVQRMTAQAEAEVLTNEAVIQMVTGKLSKDLIIGKIGSTKSGFDLSSEGIIALSTNKVDPKIVTTMIDAAQNSIRRGTAAPSLKGLDEVLTNDIIVRMVTTKVPRQLILTKIQISRSAYDISATGLVALNTAKVPEEVIKAMMAPPPPSAAAPKPIPTKEAPVPPPTAVAPKPIPTKEAPLPPPVAKPPVKKPPIPPAKKPPTQLP